MRTLNSVLIASIVIQLATTAWSIVLIAQLRDWRLVFFTAMLAMMVVRSVLAIIVQLHQHSFQHAHPPELLAEVPALLFSGLAALALLYIKRIIDHSRQAAGELERSHHILEDVPDLISRYRPDMVLTYVNEAYLKYVGQTADQVIGRSFLDDVPVSERDRVVRYVGQLCRNGGTGTIEHRVVRADGVDRWFTWTDRALLDEAGCIIELQSIGRDITEKVLAEQALRDSEERLRTIADNIPGVVYSYVHRHGLPRQLIYLGTGLAELTGPVSAAGVRERFDTLFEMLHADDAPRVRAAVQMWRQTNAIVDVECRLLCDNGNYTWVRSLGRGIHLGDGATCWHVVLIDINEHKRFENRQRLLMNELDHRVKNNLAAVLALARQAAQAACSVEEFSQAFQGRIAAMSRTHEFLAAAQWDGLEMADIVRIALGAYLDAPQPRVCAQGGRVVLPAAVAMPLSLALHELGANAVKHGALANESGTIEVRWSAQAGMLRVTWREAAGPPVPRVRVAGTGTSLLDGFICFELHGELDMDFGAHGLCCTIQIPLEPAAASESPSLTAALI